MTKRPVPKQLTPFKKGERSVGRAKGVENKINRDVKEAILWGAEHSVHSGTEGLRGYMKSLADEKREVFAALLGKMIPVQAKVQITGQDITQININMPVNEMISAVEQRIKAAYMPQLPAPKVIEHDDNEKED